MLIRLVLWTWFLAALIVGRLGLLRNVPGAVLSGLLVGLTGLLLATCFGFPAIRAWVKTIDLRVLVLLHVSRLIGFVFLVLYQRGQLPYALAAPGGWGEIVVAVLALGLVFLPLRASLRRRACIIWNTFGLVEILLLVATAVRLGFTQPWQLLAVRLLPCSMLPTFLVPLIIATHVIIYVRLSAPTETSNSPADAPADA
jgi:hypothetical protein